MALDTEKFRKRILAEKERFLADRARLVGEGESESGEVGELTDFDANHPGDAGTETFERGKDMALKENLDGMLSQIDAALARLDAGTYGICESCGKPIPPSRLEALPYATLCIEDQSRVEATQ